MFCRQCKLSILIRTVLTLSISLYATKDEVVAHSPCSNFQPKWHVSTLANSKLYLRGGQGDQVGDRISKAEFYEIVDELEKKYINNIKVAE